MKFLEITCILALCVLSLHADGNESHPKKRRIVNGTIAKLGEFPYIARIIWYWRKPKLTSVTCSATAISKDFVVTAARCYQPIIEDKKMLEDTTVLEVNLTKQYGNTQLDLNGNAKFGGFSQKRNGVTLIIHIAYMHASTMFDTNVALVRVNFPWNLDGPNNIAHLPILAKPISEDRYLQCIGVGVGVGVGVGRTTVTEKPKRVHSFKVNVGGVKLCKYLQTEYNHRNVHFDSFYMCGKSVNLHQAICMGDLGSALICDGLLAGVQSQREEDHPCQVPGAQFTLYTAIGSKQALDWIKGYIPRLFDPQEIPLVDPWNVTRTTRS